MFLLQKLRNYFSQPKAQEQDLQSETPIQLFEIIMSEANDPSEDRVSYGYIDEMDAYYLAVFDGHGGSQVSSYLQQNIKKVVTKVLTHSYRQSQNLEQAIQSSLKIIFNTLEQNILQIMNRDAVGSSKGFLNCGSCALLAIVTKTNIHIANVGDSQGLIINSDYQDTEITNSRLNTNSITEIEKLKRRFPLDQELLVSYNNTLYVKGKINLTSSIGDFSLKYKKPDNKMIEGLKIPYITKDPEIKKYRISCDDKCVLLASDGLWDLLPPSRVSEIILSHPKNQRLEMVIKECYQKCARDNNMEVSQLLQHEKKRRFIDDISIVLFDLESSL